jgi:signal transduction histidine kinase
VLIPAVLVALAWSTAAIGPVLPSRWTPPTGPTMVAVFAAQAASAILLSTAVAWILLVERRTLISIRAITYRLSPLPGGGSLQAALSGALGDPGLRLLYPLAGSADGELVDPNGRAADPPPEGATAIEHGGRVVAFIVPSVETTSGSLTNELGAAARLAAENEGLVAAVRHEVIALRASRARIVEAGDTERRRLERDLHDGAQQRLLGVLYELTIARDWPQDSQGPLRRRLGQAVTQIDHAIDALRAIARGIHHSLLTDAGLIAAIEALAVDAPIPVELDAPAELPCREESASAAWHVVTNAVRQAARLGAAGLSVRLAPEGGSLRLTITVDEPSGSLYILPMEDRVAAAGGRLTSDLRLPSQQVLDIELPCA